MFYVEMRRWEWRDDTMYNRYRIPEFERVLHDGYINYIDSVGYREDRPLARKGRRCRRCRKVLSRYNRMAICHSCWEAEAQPLIYSLRSLTWIFAPNTARSETT